MNRETRTGGFLTLLCQIPRSLRSLVVAMFRAPGDRTLAGALQVVIGTLACLGGGVTWLTFNVVAGSKGVVSWVMPALMIIASLVLGTGAVLIERRRDLHGR